MHWRHILSRSAMDEHDASSHSPIASHTWHSMLSYIIICYHMLSYVIICYHISSYVIICYHISSYVIIIYYPILGIPYILPCHPIASHTFHWPRARSWSGCVAERQMWVAATSRWCSCMRKGWNTSRRWTSLDSWVGHERWWTIHEHPWTTWRYSMILMGISWKINYGGCSIAMVWLPGGMWLFENEVERKKAPQIAGKWW